MGKNNHKSIACWFCGCFIVTLIILLGYLWHSSYIFKDSQEKIVNEHIKHLAKIDSVLYEMKTVILSNDSGTIVNAPILLSQMQKDSALFRREILLSQVESTNLMKLHIDKIDNDYSQIGIWGGILSIIFLIFGFFAIFKIEETKNEAKNVLDDVKEQEKKAIEKIKELHNQASELNNSFSSIRQNGDMLIAEKTKEFSELREAIHNTHIQSNRNLEKINKLLEDVESKNNQYNWSINTIDARMEQLETLTNQLKNIIDNCGKGTKHE